jgi:hypothetical protein
MRGRGRERERERERLTIAMESSCLSLGATQSWRAEQGLVVASKTITSLVLRRANKRLSFRLYTTSLSNCSKNRKIIVS